jgi:hypothetical protein
MKKLSFLTVLLLTLAISVPCFALGSWTAFTTTYPGRGQYMQMCATFTADAAAATIPTKTPSTAEYQKIYDDYLMFCYVKVDPGATGPTNGAWDVTLVGATTGDTDMTGASAQNFSSTVGKTVAVKDSNAVVICRPILENFAITITGNAVNSAIAEVCLIFEKVKKP